ncbi:MAG TPA: glycosyltransferase [Vicinamibacterales bacterium]
MTATHVLTAMAAPSPPSNQAPLRVCHVIGADLWAGAETQVVSTMAYLVEQPGITLTAVLFNDGRLADELRRLGVGVVVLDETRTSTLGIFLGLVRVLRAHHFDLVHLHKYKDGVLGSMAARLAGVPCIVRTMHGLAEPLHGWKQLKARIYDALDRITLQCLADLVIAVSQRMTETLWESGYHPRMVTCIRNGLDLRHVTAMRQSQDVRRELGVDADAPLIGTVGRLSAIKGHVHLLRAARRVLACQRGARFLFVGDGPLRNELLITAAELQLAGACVFPGARRDVYDVVSAMDIFALPSLNEGIPMSLLEAMALGRPVVASAVGGIPEVIQDRVNGRLVPPGDDAALAEACLELAADRELACTIGARARQTIEDSFSHERCGSALLNVYQSVATASERRMRHLS